MILVTLEISIQILFFIRPLFLKFHKKQYVVNLKDGNRYFPRNWLKSSITLTPKGLRAIFCSFLRFGHAILVRVLMLNF